MANARHSLHLGNSGPGRPAVSPFAAPSSVSSPTVPVCRGPRDRPSTGPPPDAEPEYEHGAPARPQHGATPTPPNPERAEPRARRAPTAPTEARRSPQSPPGPPKPTPGQPEAPTPHSPKAPPNNRPPPSPPGGRPPLPVDGESAGRPPLAPREPAEARPGEVHHRGRRVLRRRMLVLARSAFVRTGIGPLGE